MAAPKNHAKAGGRKPGSKNKVTQASRQLLQDVLEGEVDKIKESLAEVRKDDHHKYLSVLEKWMAYVIPKKRDITTDGEPIQTVPISGVNIIKDGVDKPPTTETDPSG